VERQRGDGEGEGGAHRAKAGLRIVDEPNRTRAILRERNNSPRMNCRVNRVASPVARVRIDAMRKINGEARIE